MNLKALLSSVLYTVNNVYSSHRVALVQFATFHDKNYQNTLGDLKAFGDVWNHRKFYEHLQLKHC